MTPDPNQTKCPKGPTGRHKPVFYTADNETRCQFCGSGQITPSEIVKYYKYYSPDDCPVKGCEMVVSHHHGEYGYSPDGPFGHNLLPTPSQPTDELEQAVRAEIKAEGFNPTHEHVDSLARRMAALIAQQRAAAQREFAEKLKDKMVHRALCSFRATGKCDCGMWLYERDIEAELAQLPGVTGDEG